MSKPTSLRLDNGTVWPNPYIDHKDLDEPARTHYINAAMSAYNHLAAHPTGVEVRIASLRRLRRAVRVLVSSASS